MILDDIVRGQKRRKSPLSFAWLSTSLFIFRVFVNFPETIYILSLFQVFPYFPGLSEPCLMSLKLHFWLISTILYKKKHSSILNALILLLVKESSAPMLQVFKFKLRKGGRWRKELCSIPSFLFAYQKLSDSRNWKYFAYIMR